MIRGWYTGASGMNAQQNRLDAIANNLANVDLSISHYFSCLLPLIIAKRLKRQKSLIKK